MNVIHKCEYNLGGKFGICSKSYELNSDTPYPILFNLCEGCRSIVIGEITAKLEDRRDEAKILYNKLLEEHPMLVNIMGKFEYNRFGGKLCAVEEEKE